MEKLNVQSKTGLYLVAILIMVMPIVIFGLTRLFSLGEPLSISQIDWFWSASCIFSGVLLFVRLKIAWIISMIQIFMVALLNMVQLFSHWGEAAVLQYNFQFLFSISMLCSILLIATYFKYPFLDRRDTMLFGIADRYQVHMKATVNDQIIGEVISASISGVLFKSQGELKFDENKNIILSIPEMKLESVPMVLVSRNDNELILKFKSLGLRLAMKLKKALKGLPKDS